MAKLWRFAWQVVLLASMSCGNGPTSFSSVGGEQGKIVDDDNADPTVRNIRAGRYSMNYDGGKFGRLVVVSFIDALESQERDKDNKHHHDHKHHHKKQGHWGNGHHHKHGLFACFHQKIEADEIWLNVQEVQLIAKNGSKIIVSDGPKSLNLLEINSDASVLFADKTIPEGAYSQIRLVLASENGHVIKDNKQYPLKISGYPENTLKINGNFRVYSGITLRLTIDFTMDSFQFRNGKEFYAKPVLVLNKEESMLPFTPGLLMMKLKSKIQVSKDQRGLPNITGIPSIDTLNQKYQVMVIANFLDYLNFQNIDPKAAEKSGVDRIFIFTYGSQTDVLLAMQEYAVDANVEKVFPDTVNQAAITIPNEPNAHNITGTQRFALNSINAYNGWDVTTGSSSIVTAVLDTGVDHQHPDLSGKVTLGDSFYLEYCGETVCTGCGCNAKDFVCVQRGTKDSTDVQFHGTHVAGTIGAITNNAQGVAGIDWQTQILSIRVLDKHGKGAVRCSNPSSPCGSDSMIGAGIVEATQQGAKVINMSLGGTSYDICYPDGRCYSGSPAESAAVEYAFARGVVVVAAAGNSGIETGLSPNSAGRPVSAPASFPQVISVGAVNTGGITRAGFSNFGKVDVMAPGTNILSTLPNGTYGTLSGTSMAAPHVSGLASLIFARNRNLLPETIARAIYTSATDITAIVDPNPSCVIGNGLDNCTGWGLIDVFATLNSVLVVPVPIDNGDGTITDVTTLMWMKCSLGQNLTDPGCAGTAGAYIWSNSFSACGDLNFAGYTDWRLPSRDELNSIITCRNGAPRPPANNIGKCYSIPQGPPNINATYFPNTPGGFTTSIYWTSTNFGSCGTLNPCPWVTAFDPGGTGYGVSANFGGRVRCVRGP